MSGDGISEQVHINVIDHIDAGVLLVTQVKLHTKQLTRAAHMFI
jgi:hypothetical protein